MLPFRDGAKPRLFSSASWFAPAIIAALCANGIMPIENGTQPSEVRNNPMRWLKRLAMFFFTLTLRLAGGVAFVWYQAFEPYYRVGKVLTFNDSPNRPTVGVLGGIPISISPGIACFVEYQDDPHFLISRQGPPSTRSLQSKFRSFGFKVCYPDMTLTYDETPEERRKIHIHNMMWLMIVGVRIDPSQFGF
jgi:hypothetical protein